MASSHGHDASEPCPCRASKWLANSWTAAQYGDVDRMRHLLLVHGRDPNVKDEYNRTPLHFAAAHGHEDVVRLLLSKAANVNANDCGALPLHRAAYGGHCTIVRLLLKAGGRINDRDSSTGDLRTPLAKAASGGHAQACGVLLEAGADARVSDARGLLPWQLVPLEPGDAAALAVRLGVAAGIDAGEVARYREEAQSQSRDALPQHTAAAAAVHPPALHVTSAPASHASFGVRCPDCGQTVMATRRVVWESGEKAVCEACARAAALGMC